MKRFGVLLVTGLAFLVIGSWLLTPQANVSKPFSTANEKNQPILTPPTTTTQNPAATEGISESALNQINALLAEKETRSPVQRKIDSNLLYTLKQSRGERVAEGVGTLETGVKPDARGMVEIDMTATISKSLLQQLKGLGGELGYVNEAYRSIRATVPLKQIETIAGWPEVIFVMPKQDARTDRVTPNAPVDLVGKIPAGPASAPHAINPSMTKRLRPDFATRAERVRKQVEQALAAQDGTSPQAGRFAPEIVNTSQGDKAHKADAARSSFGVTGAGVKIGILSDGVDSLASLQASGDLGTVTVLSGQAGSGDEGSAMLEIVHDLAPGAQLFFATAFTSITSFAQNIRDLRTAGCDIIVDDVFYFVESPFQDGQAPAVVSNTNGGVVIQSVKDVTAAGALYFSSAGNDGNKNDNMSGTWEGDFADAGPTGAPIPAGSTGNLHDFDTSAAVVGFNTITTSGFTTLLNWSDPLGASANDYDLFVLNSTGTTVSSSSTNIQSGTQDPFERAGTPSSGQRIVVVKKTGAANRYLHIGTAGGILTFSTPGVTGGHACTTSIGSYSVAASPSGPAKFNTTDPPGPFPGAFVSTNKVETFSSDGPRRIFFNADSSAITPGNFSSTGGQLLQKPDVTAADGVSCAAPGFDPFFGTSAAAPHAGAIAALLKQAKPTATQAQIRTALTSSAVDIEAAGVDQDSGAGILLADAALTAIGATPIPVLGANGMAITAGNCGTPTTAAVDPGETVTVNLTLNNTGAANTNGPVRATLNQALSTNVTSVGGTNPQTYPQINVAASQTQSFTFTAGGTCGQNVVVRLDLADGAGFTNSLGFITFTFLLGVQTNQTFSNTAPITIVDNAAGSPYPSNITVSGVTSTVGRITVTLTGLTHTFPADIDIILVGPGGQKAYVMSDVGGTAAPGAPVTLTFDDQAAAMLTTSGLSSGTFKPSNASGDTSTDTFPAPAPAQPYSADFSVFAGLSPANANGTWSLYVRDDVGTDSGSISGGWTLNLITTTCGTCGGGPNTPPTITAGAAVARTQGGTASTATIATVSDAETAAGSLTVAATTVPTGITVTGITNTNGTVTATVSASCTATIGANTVVLTVTDGGGLTATANFTVNVTANTAPTLGTYPNTTVGVGGGGTVTPSAAPTDNGTVATVTAAAPGFTGTLTGNATTGVITVANANAGGPFTVTVTATDNCGTTSTATFTLTVTANTPPTITPSPISRQQGSAGTVGTIATVNDVETPAGSLTVTATTVPTGLTVTGITNTGGTITANVAASCTATIGANTVVLTVTDGSGGSTTGNLIVTVTANTAPVLGTYPNITVNQTQTGTSTPSAAPTDNGSVVSVTAAAPGFTGTLAGNAATGVITVSNTAPAGTFTVTVTATDNCGATSTATFTLTVPANSPPSITPATGLTRQQGSSSGLVTIATVSDPETPANNLTVTATTVPAGLTVTSLSNLFGTVTAIVTASCTATVGANTIVLTVTDGGGLSVTGNLIVTVTANTAPTLGTYANAFVSTGNPVTVTPTAAPSDNGTVASVVVVASAGYTGGLTINTITGAVTLTPTTAGSFTITVTATDNCGATTVQTFTLNTTPFQKGPFITTISPTAGTRGSTVTITGGNFNQVTTVLFNGAPASFTIDSSTQITATVPNGATTGSIVLIAAGGSSVTGPTFTVIRVK